MKLEVSALVKRTYRVCARVVGGVCLALAVIVVVAGLRLMAGPVDLDFLKTRIAEAADVPGNDITPDADRISLEWGGLGEPMRLVFTGLRFTNGQHQVIATAPKAALTFDPRSVFQGMLLPTSITIERPTIEAEIDRDGGMMRRIFSDSSSQSQGEAVAILVEQLLAEPNYKSLIGQLYTVKIEQARLALRDTKTGITWVAPSAHGELRRDATGVIIAADARFSSGGDPIDVALTGVYARDRSRFSVDANVAGLKPSMFAELSPDAAILRGLNIALAARLHIDGDGEGDVRDVAIDVTGGNGVVTLPGILPAPQPVKSVNAHASVDAATHTAKIDSIDFDFGAAKVRVTGTGTKTAEGQVFAGHAEVLHVPVDHMGDYWPLAFAPGGREWARANLSKGEIDLAADFALSTPGNDLAELKVDRLVGLIDYRGMMVRYMPHMPELESVSGKARYEGDALHFDVASGTAVGLRTAGATIDLTGLLGPVQNASLHLPIAGSAPNVVRFLARPQLGLSREMLYDYRRVGGEASIDLSLSLPAAEFRDALRARHQGRRFGLEVFAEECRGRRRSHRRCPADQVLRSRAQRHRQRQARRQCGRDRLARDVRRQGRVPPPLRTQGHGAGPARRQGGLSLGRALRDGARRHDAALPGGDQRHERGGRPLRDQGCQGGAGAARLDQGAGHRRPGAGDAEARRRRQAYHHRFRRARQRPARQGPGALRRRQRRAADRAAADQDRADRRRGRLEEACWAASSSRCVARPSSCRACAP